MECQKLKQLEELKVHYETVEGLTEEERNEIMIEIQDSINEVREYIREVEQGLAVRPYGGNDGMLL